MEAFSILVPNESGGIVDDLLVYRINEAAYMLVVNASNIDKDWAWVQKFNTKEVEMHNISDQTSLLAVQGPKAVEVLKGLTDMDMDRSWKLYKKENNSNGLVELIDDDDVKFIEKYKDQGMSKNMIIALDGYGSKKRWHKLFKSRM